MSSVIYYFSGSGNSLKVAKDIASKLGNTELIKICKENTSEISHKPYTKVGIIFPVYYYGLPVMVKEFVQNLNVCEGCYIYVVATCGGSVGAAIKQTKDILHKKSLTLSSAYTILMPDNYQVMMAPPSIEKQQKLFKLEQEKIEQIIESISKAQTVPFDEINSISAKLLGATLSKAFKPKTKDKNFWTCDNCNGCSICVKVCPSNNIVLENKRPQWLHQCEHCLACMHWCPKQAIQYRKGTLKRDRYHHPEIKVSDMFNDMK
jgi:ferredoxin/flavodoxin